MAECVEVEAKMSLLDEIQAASELVARSKPPNEACTCEWIILAASLGGRLRKTRDHLARC